MNVELLKEFCEKILEFENLYGVQAELSNLQAGLQNLAGNPQDQGQQTQVSKSLSALHNAINQFDYEFSPKEQEKFRAIKAENFFTSNFVDDIKEKIAENPMSPAVVRDHVNQITEIRRQYLENLKSLVDNLEKIGIEVDELEDNETQIGFQIPREIFHNNLDGLILELNAICKIIRAFSEVTTGNIEEIKVGQISTTDPLIFLAQSAPIAFALAKTVEWILAQWKEIEEIRHLRAQTAQIKQFTKKEVETLFDTKIKEIVDNGIKEKVAEILKSSPLDKGRKNELEKSLKDAIKSLFARIERGMTIELRMLPLEEIDEDSDESQENVDVNFELLKEIQSMQITLKFPEPNAKPILKLPKATKQKEDIEET